MSIFKRQLTHWKLAALIVSAALFTQALIPALLPKASAAGNLSFTMVRFDRMKTNTPTTGTVCAKPASATTVAGVKVTFPTGYTVSSTTSNWTVSTATTTGWPTGWTAWPSIAAPTGSGDFVISGQSVTFGSGALTAGTLYCFNWTNSAALTTETAAQSGNQGTVTTRSAVPADIDTGTYQTATITDDQIAVTATVGASFTFTLASNSASLGTLTSTGPSNSTAIDATISSNSQAGWEMWAADLNTTKGLTSTTASYTIANATGGYTPAAGNTAAALSVGTEGYNLGAGTASGTTCTGVTTDGNFASGGTSYKGGGLDGTLRQLASATGVASSCALPLTINAEVSATTPAASDYSGSMTIVAAGNF